ncbi:hypothetical protein D3C76_23100 [compost metagenome]
MGEFNGIVHHIQEHLLQAVAVPADDGAALGFVLEFQLNLLLLRLGPDIQHRFLKQFLEVHLADHQLHFIGLQFREIKDLFDETD